MEDLSRRSQSTFIMADERSTSYAVYRYSILQWNADVDGDVWSAIAANHRVCGSSPVELWKACKSPAEISGMVNCHMRDGAALSHCLAQLEMESGPVNLEGTCMTRETGRSEVDIDQLLTYLREVYSGDEMFIGRSFPTIAGVGPNGAVVHYRWWQHIRFPLSIPDSVVMAVSQSWCQQLSVFAPSMWNGRHAFTRLWWTVRGRNHWYGCMHAMTTFSVNLFPLSL